MSRKALPATTFSEIISRTAEQKATVRRLEAEGWIIVTEPESIFNGSMLMEGPPVGESFYILPDGTVEAQYGEEKESP